MWIEMLCDINHGDKTRGGIATGEIVEVNYTLGKNLVFVGKAVEVPAPDNKAKALDTPTVDKMVHGDQPKRKRGRPRKAAVEV